MRPPRRPRILSGEEARLWGEIAKLITPLRGRPEPTPGPTDPQSVPSKAEARRPGTSTTPQSKRTVAPQPTPQPTKPAAKPAPHRRLKLADLVAPAPPQSRPVNLIAAPKPPGLERRERMGLRRGSLAIDARIDLHGLYQADAHAALVGFLLRAREAGHARVLVVTGKGGDKGSESSFAERGVLRRSVPHWLRGAELGHFVLGFEEAGRHHGGTGALYVRLRRR